MQLTTVTQPAGAAGEPERSRSPLPALHASHRRHEPCDSSPTAGSLLSAVAIAPDGTWIATAGEAGTVRTWVAAGTPAPSSSATNQR